jgi:tetratricopeptide (TPR) repeat protein
MKCDRCGIEGEREEAFFKTPRSGSTRQLHLCPPCWRKRRERSGWTSLISTLALAAGGACLAAFHVPIGWLFLNLSLFQVFVILGTVPHEAGHALAARLLGMRLFQVSIGYGKPVYERNVGDVLITLNKYPYGGFTIASSRTKSWFRSRYLLFIAAGPLANFLLAAAVWPWAHSFAIEDFARRVRPCPLFLAANLVIVLNNLIPRRTPTQKALGRLGTDGLQLLITPFLTQEKIRLRLADCSTREAVVARKSGRHEDARIWFERAAAQAPDEVSTRTNLALNLLDLGRLEEALAAFLRILESTSLKPLEKAIIQNNIAYTSIRTGREDLFEEADRLSREALAVLPTLAAVKGTRGSVLCATDRLEEGIPLLKQAMEEHDDAKNKALNACELAIAEQKRGNLQASEEFWKSARSLDPLCPLLNQK